LNKRKVIWCYVELGIEFERIDWGGAFGGNDDPAYRTMNLYGRVPTIKNGDAVIWESNTILRYRCTTPGSTRLHPADSAGGSAIERMMDWQLAVFNPSMTTLLSGYYRTPQEKRDPAMLESARKHAIMQWSIVEKWLDERDYLAGSQTTLADIRNGIFVYRWHNYPIEWPNLPRIRSWYKRLPDRPKFQTDVAGPVS
jgi:glutathione S-transferase